MPLLYYDNTRISTYRECNRKFYLRHMLDLTREGEKIDLVFGSAWHEAMNTLWPDTAAGKPKQEVMKNAFIAFTKKWMEAGFPEPTSANYQTITDKYMPKNPYTALEMLQNYYDQRLPFIRDCTEVEVERPFAVPLGMTIPITNKETGEVTSEEVFYIGRLDKIVKHRQHGRLIIEHKTTGWYAKEGGFRSDYLESFSPNSQVDGYLFAGSSLYTEGVKGIWVDAALTHKTVHDKFKFIPLDRQFSALDAWLTETRIWVTRIAGEVSDVEQGAEYAGSFRNFPKNTGSCHAFSGCTYRDLCKYLPDPRTVGIPSGFKVEAWEPFDLLKIGQIMQRKGD